MGLHLVLSEPIMQNAIQKISSQHGGRSGKQNFNYRLVVQDYNTDINMQLKQTGSIVNMKGNLGTMKLKLHVSSRSQDGFELKS